MLMVGDRKSFVLVQPECYLSPVILNQEVAFSQHSCPFPPSQKKANFYLESVASFVQKFITLSPCCMRPHIVLVWNPGFSTFYCDFNNEEFTNANELHFILHFFKKNINLHPVLLLSILKYTLNETSEIQRCKLLESNAHFPFYITDDSQHFLFCFLFFIL